ncbi:hypothetical protein MKX01_001627 [Papaver californicum]|nr:hypothetical protein MKX01_001627 [Papaver californicum]
MARTSITTLYTGFFFVLMVIFVTAGSLATPVEHGEIQGEREGTLQNGGLSGNGELNAVDGQLNEKRDGMLNANTENVGLNGKTTGSRNVGNGLVKEDNTLSGNGNLPDLKGRMKGNEAVNVGDGLVTGDVGVKPKGNLKDGTLEVTGQAPWGLEEGL